MELETQIIMGQPSEQYLQKVSGHDECSQFHETCPLSTLDTNKGDVWVRVKASQNGHSSVGYFSIALSVVGVSKEGSSTSSDEVGIMRLVVPSFWLCFNHM